MLRSTTNHATPQQNPRINRADQRSSQERAMGRLQLAASAVRRVFCGPTTMKIDRALQQLGGTSGRVLERNLRVDKIYDDFDELKKLDADYKTMPEGDEKNKKLFCIRDHLRDLSSALFDMHRHIEDNSLSRELVDLNDKQNLTNIVRELGEIFNQYRLEREKPTASK